MRIARLGLERYGHFSERTLEFAAGEGMPDLHVVFGANEAGKSVFRKSLSDFLFGFGEQTFANFACDYSDLLITGVLENEQNGNRQTLSCQRRKRRKDPLLDAAGRPLEQRQLDEWLAGVTRARYENEFALDQPQMEKSAASLLKGGERFFYAMFSAVSGMDAVFAVHQQLHSQRDENWHSDQRRKTRYRQLQAVGKECDRKLGELQLAAPARQQVQDQLTEAQAAIDEIAAGHRARRQDAARLASLDRAESVLVRIEEDRVKLDQLRAEAETAGLKRVLAAGDRIEELGQKRALAAAADQESAQLAREVDQRQATIKAQAAALGWDEPDIAARLPAREKSERLTVLAHEIIQSRARQQDLNSELVDSRAQLAALLSRLQPWQGEAADFGRLQPLAMSEYRVDLGEMQRLRALSEACRSKLADAQNELAARQEEIGEAGKKGQAVAREDVEQAREERDRKFALLIEAKQPQKHAADYRQAVARADELADARMENAQQSARLDQQSEQAKLWRTRVARYEHEQRDAQSALEEHTRRWEEKMQACSLAGLTLARYGEWHDEYERAREQVESIRRLEARLAEAAPASQTEYERLLGECSLNGVDDVKVVLKAVAGMDEIERERQLLAKAKAARSKALALVDDFAAQVGQLAGELVGEAAAASAEQALTRLVQLHKQALADQAQLDSLQEQRQRLQAELATIESGCDDEQWRRRIEAEPQAARRSRQQEIEREEESHQQALEAALAQKGALERETTVYGQDDEQAAQVRQLHHQATVGMAEAVAGHLRASAMLAVLREALVRYQAQVVGGRDLLAVAGEYLARMTGNRYRGLDYEDERLLAVRGDTKLGLDQLSTGTRDQVYLSLRLAGLEQQARTRSALPFIADDLFASFDDERSRGGFAVLAEIARHTQVIFLTHHRHLLELAREALPGISELHL